MDFNEQGIEQDISLAFKNLSSGDWETTLQSISDKYGFDVTIDNFIRAFGSASKNFFINPYIQNRRVKQILTTPKKYTEEVINEMAMNPGENEQGLRSVEKHLEGTTPLGEIRKTYQDMPLYYHYAYPTGNDNKEYKQEDFEIDEKLIDNIFRKANFSSIGKEICGQALQEGKVFRWLRDNISTVYVDKKNPDGSISKVKNHIVNMFNLTPLPSDWIKIVGYNDMSKYTVALNMFYFMQPGVDINDYMELIKPYYDDFKCCVFEGKNKKYNIDMEEFNKVARNIRDKCNSTENIEKFKDIKKRISEGGYIPEVYKKNGIQYYWVILPIDRVYPFEIDPSTTSVSPLFSNMFTSMMRISKGEQIQMEILQNPLVAFVTGSVPFEDNKGKATKPTPKLSPSMIEYWLRRFLYSLSENNVNGIGAMFMPLEDIKFHQMSESPSAGEMATQMYQYTMLKANVGGLLPITEKPLAEQVKASQKIKSKYSQEIYNCFIRMMNNYFLYSDKLKYNWKFDMFGDVFTIDDERSQIKEDISNGINSSLYKKFAIEGKTLLNARQMLKSINKSGILDMLKPINTVYTKKDNESGRPTNEENNIEDSEATEKNRDY